ncbi:MAG: hypothetical protein AAF597_12565, partial [Bacteroidota bacterium]
PPPTPGGLGQPYPRRPARARATALTLLVADASGRLIETRRLPSATHHLAEVTFPAPGSYTLHLRPRLNNRQAPTTTLKVIAQ